MLVARTEQNDRIFLTYTLPAVYLLNTAAKDKKYQFVKIVRMIYVGKPSVLYKLKNIICGGFYLHFFKFIRHRQILLTQKIKCRLNYSTKRKINQYNGQKTHKFDK